MKRCSQHIVEGKKSKLQNNLYSMSLLLKNEFIHVEKTYRSYFLKMDEDLFIFKRKIAYEIDF